MLRVSPSIKLCKGDNIKALGLQGQGVKALYLKRKFRHSSMLMSLYPQSKCGYYYGRKSNVDVIVSTFRDQPMRPVGPYNIIFSIKVKIE